MFKKVLKELERMKRIQLSIPIQTDEDGYYDKECPSGTCMFQFKILAEDWADKVSDDSVFCPLCGHNAPANSFWTTEQIEDGQKQAKNQIMHRLNKAFEQDAKDFNRCQPKNGFLTVKAEFRGANTHSYILPILAKKELEQKIECQQCGVRYSVLGSAFFCPCCGHNSVDVTFDNSLKKIESKIKHIPAIREKVAEISADEAELTIRSLIESGLGECLVAFQSFCDQKFKELDRSNTKVKFNAFQNLEIGGGYWENLFGESYEKWLTLSEYRDLGILFQKRHLLAHSEGIVDQKYIEKTSDTTYKVGQRIVVKENDVISMVSLIRKIIEAIRAKSNSANG